MIHEDKQMFTWFENLKAHGNTRVIMYDAQMNRMSESTESWYENGEAINEIQFGKIGSRYQLFDEEFLIKSFEQNE